MTKKNQNKKEKDPLEELSGLEIFFMDKELRREVIKMGMERIEQERKKWIKDNCTIKLEHLKYLKDLKEKIWYFLTIPFDWYYINRYFTLLERNLRRIFELCDYSLNERESEKILEELKKEIGELKFLDKKFASYCGFENFYFHNIIKLFSEKFLQFGKNEKINEIIRKIIEII